MTSISLYLSDCITNSLPIFYGTLANDVQDNSPTQSSMPQTHKSSLSWKPWPFLLLRWRALTWGKSYVGLGYSWFRFKGVWTASSTWSHIPGHQHYHSSLTCVCPEVGMRLSVCMCVLWLFAFLGGIVYDLTSSVVIAATPSRPSRRAAHTIVSGFPVVQLERETKI